MTKFYIAPTKIASYFGCPYKYLLGTQYQYTGELPRALREGIQFHSIMEGEEVEDAPDRIQHMAKQTKIFMNKEGYEVIGGEVLETVHIAGTDYHLSRKIDAYAYLNGEPVLVDYKTARYAWKKMPGGQYPQGMTFQADAYLIPPSDPKNNPFGGDIWPEKIHFIVSTERSVSAIEYTGDQHSYRNLLIAIKQIHEARQYPKNVGYGCTIGDTGCEFYKACFKIPGWEQEYKRKGRYRK